MNALEKALHERALDIASRYRRVEVELLEVLQRIDEKKVFRALGFSSLFQYAVGALKLSEAVAYNFITVARKAREIPQITAEIRAGNLSVSIARKITPVVSSSNAADWLEKAKTLPRAALEREVAKVVPQVLTPERSKIVAANRVALQVGVSDELFEKLSRVKDILSQKLRRAATLEDALSAMTDLFLEKNDPVAKAERAVERHNAAQPVTGQVSIPARVRHEVILRDDARCSATLPSGERCGERRWLDVHHIIPRRDGGGHGVENLQMLCFSHHRRVHDCAGSSSG